MRFNNLFYSAGFLCAATSVIAGVTPEVDPSEIQNDSGFLGITYTPYRADGTCKSFDEIASDFSKLKDFPNVRLYDVDCDQVRIALKSKNEYQKLFVGIRNFENPSSSIDTLVKAVEEAGSWDDIETVALGNELVNGDLATVKQLSDGVQNLRTTLRYYGYKGPVVTVDTFIAVLQNPALCNISDYVAINAHPYFDFNTQHYEAGSWVEDQILKVSDVCRGKDVVVTETGWPHGGEQYGEAIPNRENQKEAIQYIGDYVGSESYLFSAFDEQWKVDGPHGVEKKWGVFAN